MGNAITTSALAVPPVSHPAPQGAANRDGLIPPDAAEVIALYRAREGSLYRGQFPDEYRINNTRHAPQWLARAAEKARMAELIHCGPDGPRGMPVTLTDTGRKRYEELQRTYVRAQHPDGTRLHAERQG